MKFFFLFFTNILIAFLSQCVKCDAQPTKLPISKHNFMVIAHRGAHKSHPENTLSAFNEAIAIGADYIELDLRTSKDGKLVIMHDETVDRTSNGQGRVDDLSWSQLKRLYIGANEEHKREHIPTLNEVLKQCKGKINIYLDFKDADVRYTWKMINKYGMARQVIVYCNTEEQFREWYKIAPEIPLMISLPDTVKSASQLAGILRSNPISILDGGYDVYNTNIIEMANTLNVAVWPDIQGADEFQKWEYAIRLGFRGLQTDHPEELINWLEAHKLR